MSISLAGRRKPGQCRPGDLDEAFSSRRPRRFRQPGARRARKGSPPCASGPAASRSRPPRAVVVGFLATWDCVVSWPYLLLGAEYDLTHRISDRPLTTRPTERDGREHAPEHRVEDVAEAVRVLGGRVDVPNRRVEVANGGVEVANGGVEVANGGVEAASGRVEVAKWSVHVAEQRVDPVRERVNCPGQRVDPVRERVNCPGQCGDRVDETANRCRSVGDPSARLARPIRGATHRPPHARPSIRLGRNPPNRHALLPGRASSTPTTTPLLMWGANVGSVRGATVNVDPDAASKETPRADHRRAGRIRVGCSTSSIRRIGTLAGIRADTATWDTGRVASRRRRIV